MERGGFAPKNEPSLKQLPPRELWTYDPFEEGRLATPIDEHGFVDLQALIRQIKQTVQPMYDWRSDLNDYHHLYWPNAWYDELPYSSVDPQQFRNIASNKLYVPRTFHNWLHVTTEPPEPPDEEPIRHFLEAQRVAHSLYQSVRTSRELYNRPWTRPGLLEKGNRYHRQAYSEIREQLYQLPEEFRPFELPKGELSSVDELPVLASQIKLGKFCTNATVRQVPSRNPRAAGHLVDVT